MSKQRPSTRILKDKDDVSHSESLAIIKHIRDTGSGLIIPENLQIERKANCGYCGRAFDNAETMRYYNEYFHSSCVNEMLRGSTNS